MRRRTALFPSSPTLRGCAQPGKPLGEDGSRTVKPCGPGTRCWCHVGGGVFDPTGSDGTTQFADDGDKTNSSPGRARSIPLKPLCRESRIASAEPVVTPCALFLHRGRGCSERPAFPAPSASEGRTDHANLGRNAPRAYEAVSSVIASKTSNP